MIVDSEYQEHISVMKKLNMGEGFYEARDPYKEDFEKIYQQAQTEEVTVSNAKEFLNSLSKEELSTLQNYTLLVNEIEIDSLSDEGAYNLLVHHYEKYDFDKDGVIEDGIAKTRSLIPQSLDTTSKEALVETFNAMDFKDVMMTSFVMFPPNFRIEDNKIVHGEYQEYDYNAIINNMTNFLDPKSQNSYSSELKENIISTMELFKKNYENELEKESVLASYTRTNSASPNESKEINSTQELGSASIEVSEKDKRIFDSIIEDKFISYEELKYLSYEQVQLLPKYVMKKDEEGNLIKSSMLDSDRKAGMLMSSTVISNNTNFNKAVFHSIKKIEDNEFLETFMYEITGTKLNDNLVAYPELQEQDYSKEGTSMFIEKKIASYQVALDQAKTEEEKENYQALLGSFTGLNNMVKSFNGQSIHDNSDPLERMKALVNDIVSVLKTGFSEEELELIEKLLEEIRKRIRENKEGASHSPEEINQMMKELERAVAELKKRITGVVIIDMENSSSNKIDPLSFATSETLNFDARLDKIQQTVDELKNGKVILSETATDEEKKEEDKEW